MTQPKAPYPDKPMYACPRFERCNAPICPLDADWRERTYVSGDPVCAWLLEAGKPTWEAVRGAYLASELADEVVRQAPEILTTHGAIRRSVQRSSTKASKVLMGARIKVTG